ncbi:MAG: SAM-dependent methyltransferase [Verrucomicrobia bacterium]|nr:SAM-dependent methyltransferase [Verrucomicrobiota bacterium]
MIAAQDKLFDLFRDALARGTFVKLTISRPRDPAADVKNVFLRPVRLKDGFRVAFTYRHGTKDIFKNLPPEAALAEAASLLSASFLCATLFTTERTAELTIREDDSARIAVRKPAHLEVPSLGHDRTKVRGILPTEPWLRELGVTLPDGRVREAMADKFRQINQFVEVLRPLLAEAFAQGAATPLAAEAGGDGLGETARLKRRARRQTEASRAATVLIQRPLTVVDMGCGKGYLTFAVSQLLEQMNFVGSRVVGVETRADLVEETNRAASACGFERLHFQAGSISGTPLDTADALLALHACDTATDDALARGIGAGARLLVVSPCCHKELRPQIIPPPALAPALRHGILMEREAEFATDALRAALLEWAGYETKVFEFISTEHTAKNLMITAVKRRQRGDNSDELAARVRGLACFYGVKEQRLAALLGFTLTDEGGAKPEAPGHG